MGQAAPSGCSAKVLGGAARAREKSFSGYSSREPAHRCTTGGFRANVVTGRCELAELTGYGLRRFSLVRVESHCETTKFSLCPTGGQVVAGSNAGSPTKLKQFRGGFGVVRDRLFSYLPGCVRQPT